MEELRNDYRIFNSEPGGRSPLGRSGQRWEDLLKLMFVNGGGLCGSLAGLMNMKMKFRVP